MIDLSGERWLSAPATQAVMAALEAAGGGGCARFVGGCVRNAILGAPVSDIDIATMLEPPAVRAALSKAGLKAVPTGEAHGTITAVAMGEAFEVTTLRRDVETDGRRAVVAFSTDWAEDAARRDFRLNALYADRAGRIFDPTGAGMADAQARRIVFVGDPEQRIREDYLRILRFFRFFAWYGRGEMDARGLAACAALADGVERLSAERVSKELLRLLEADDPVPAVRAMDEAGVLGRLLPAGFDVGRLERVATRTGDPVIRLAALSLSASEGGEAADAMARRLRLSNAMRDRLAAMADGGLNPADAATARAAIYRLGRSAFEDRVRLGGGAAEPWLALAEAWTPPRLPVGGADVARAGLPAGPLTGQALKAFENGWVADDFPTEGHAARLAAIVSGLGAAR